jgi:AmmeMemoRadiSam system protein B
MVRKPVVAGSFYPSRPEELKATLSGMVDPGSEKKKAISVVSPHAGFVYSGPVAGALFSSVQLPAKYVLLGPSHRMVRSRFAVITEGSWEIPLGRIPIDSDLADKIARHSDLLEEDEDAHSQEHSLEVQLPFIQFLVQDISIVPICIGYHASFKELEELGKAVAQGIEGIGEDVLMVASTDMSHYVTQEEAERLDFMAINEIERLNPKGLYDTVTSKNISMCGFQPTVSVLVASLELGAQNASLIKYQTSGDITGNYREVVGYAGIRIE